MIDKIRQLLRDGEGLTIEFKSCESELGNSVYETVTAFSNRYGGYILLGVEDKGIVKGVNPEKVEKMKKDFASLLNNQEKFTPTLFLSLENEKINGKTILWCYVPPTSQVVIYGGKIFDRNVDGDMDITRNSEMVAQIHRRKSADYSEREIFPYAKEKDFEFTRLMPKVRRLAANRFDDHPWINMSDNEILRSSGLYQEDPKAGKVGYNLAAILLFGKDELIRACTPNYVTDAICRRENLDRYDDRLMVMTNLIDAYEQLMDFISKHTLDKFHLMGDQSVSLRSKIAREIVSNILVHREYTSAFPAKIIIERDRIVTENWNLPKAPGRIDPNNFSPFPKNPLLAHFFINIGRADVLGSGVRNLYEFTKLYSGGEPELIDGDIFKTIIPLSNENSIISDKSAISSDRSSDRSSDKSTINSDRAAIEISDRFSVIINYLKQNGSGKNADFAKLLNLSPQRVREILKEMTIGGHINKHGERKYTYYTIKKNRVE